MKRIELDHWYTIDNTLDISLMRFHVEIKILDNYFQMELINSLRQTITLNFNTLEDAITFTETTVKKAHDYNEIIKKYEEQMKDKDIHNLARALMASYEELYNYYEPIVRMIIDKKNKDINYIENTLDNIMDIYTDKGFDLFIELQTYYQTVNKENAQEYLEILKDSREEEYHEYVKKLVKQN